MTSRDARRRTWAATLIAGLLAAGASAVTIGAQTPTPSSKFDVASVKPNRSGAQGVRIQFQPGGRFTATNATLRQLIREAYQVQNFQMAGGPAWIASDTFDLAATGASGDVNVALQNLLADRFKLKLQREHRDMPIYALTMARSDKRLGPQLKPTNPPCTGADCGIFASPAKITAKSATMAELARVLPAQGRLVVDRTGLTGPFAFQLLWSPEMTAADQKKLDAVPNGPIDPNGSSLFTAIREQLGLSLESTRGPVEVLVIESAERPTEN